MRVSKLQFGLAVLIAVLVIGFVWRPWKSEEVYNGKIFKIGRDPTWYPLDFHGKEKNMVGFTNELVRAIAKEENLRIQVIDSSPFALIEKLNKGEFNGVFLTLSPTPYNEDKYLFSNPIYLAGLVIVVRENSDIKSLDDLKGKRVGLDSGDNVVFNLTKLPVFLSLPYENLSAALDNLVIDNNDAVITDVLDASAYATGFLQGEIKIVTPLLNDFGFRLVTQKGKAEQSFILKFNEGLKKIVDSGVYKELVDKWRLVDTLHEGS
jgi:polar amino acid transport system substrate-binding protein